MNLFGKKIVFLGDSITEGHGVASIRNRFSDRIASMTGAICANYGIGGTRIAKQTKPSENPRWDLDFISRVDEMDSDADIVVVFGGTNDWGHGDAPFGDFASRDPYTFYGALHVLFASLVEKYPSAQFAIITPLHRANEMNPAEANGRRTNAPETLKDYVEAIREVAEYYSLPVLDLYKTSGIQPQIPVMKEKYMPDALHPNDEGHRLLANHIIKFLESL